MSKDVIVNRIAQLAQAIEQSAASHNALLGRFNEAKDLLAAIESAGESIVEAVEEAVQDVLPAANE